VTKSGALLRSVFLACLLTAGHASAFELGVGLELGGTLTSVSNDVLTGSTTAGAFSFGLLLEQRFDLPQALIEIWEDVQPTSLQVESGVAGQNAAYLPIDVGLRLGLATSAIQPYVGVLAQWLILTSKPSQAALNNDALGIGGELGVDFALFFIRIGLDTRLTETVTGLAKKAYGAPPVDPGNALVFQVLGSIRVAL
jgi:hypothetical protein